ncbi:MAG TPA: hypothetical protein VIM73_18310, partial [Polyangiaceae bacterium]
SLPYCRHVDERTWTEIAMRIARNGDLNPHRFTKPSVMVYLTTAGIAFGLIRAGSKGEASGPDSLGKRAYPHYRLPSVLEVPKRLFAFGSVAAMGMAGVCAWLIGRNKWLLALAPFFACLSAAYLSQSWEYINADIIGAFFVLATVTHLLVEHARKGDFVGTVSFALVHGLLAGLTLGCKYNLFPIVVPYLLYACFFLRDRLVSRWLTFLLATIAGFIISTPYALFAMDEFLLGAVREARHYATDHKGASTPAGWKMLLQYLGDLRASYGIPVLLVALVGFVFAIKRNLRLTIVAFSFPLAFLAYMCSQKVFFARNIVSLHLFVAIAAAIGLIEIVRSIQRITSTSRRLTQMPRWKLRVLIAIPAVACVSLGLPWKSAYGMYSYHVESRKVAERVVLQQGRPGAEVLVDDHLLMDTWALERIFEVSGFDEEWEATLTRFLESEKGTLLVAPLRSGDLLREAKRAGAEVLLQLGIDDLHPKGALGGDPKLVVLRR